MNAAGALSELLPSAPAGGERLWSALGRPFVRRLPPRGFDVAGEYIAGVAARRIPVKRLRRRAEGIVERAESLRQTSDAALKAGIEQAADGVRLRRDDPACIDEAFALGHEAIRRVLSLSLYVEQVMGGLAMAMGCCTEMATGEGKTVTAILPAAIDGWRGRGVHVITVNDYLSKRDAEITRPAYRFLGLSVGVLQDETPPPERQKAYSQAVTYGADKQFIFDFLRDRLMIPLGVTLTSHLLESLATAQAGLRHGPRANSETSSPEWSQRIMQRGLHAAIVDEADSVLIDEAVTPAIIALESKENHAWAGQEHYRIAADVARQLECDQDYRVLLRERRVLLTERGRRRVTEMAGGLPPFWSGPRRREELVQQALAAKELYRRDDDYIVREGKNGPEVVIVDRSTGRILEGRQWQLGVHQAVEAKEGIEIASTRVVSARTSYQRFFQRYERLSGMTGTAAEVRHELYRDYRLPIVRIPTHRKVIRKHLPDQVFVKKEQKFEGVARHVATLHQQRRPVLVGTRSVADSELLGELLAARGIHCRILNARREKEEAQIIAEAGQPGAVTVATNMAGRGTDILLTEESRASGGLVVIATERHAETRVDRQLFGRSGRQGDPGVAQAFVALDDPVIIEFGLSPLAWAARSAPGPLRRFAARLLWKQAQQTAGRRAALTRRETARREAFLEMAMPEETR